MADKQFMSKEEVDKYLKSIDKSKYSFSRVIASMMVWLVIFGIIGLIIKFALWSWNWVI